jgi:hypothetical protein
MIPQADAVGLQHLLYDGNGQQQQIDCDRLYVFPRILSHLEVVSFCCQITTRAITNRRGVGVHARHVARICLLQR